MRIDFSQPWLGSDGNVIVAGTALERMEAPGRVGRFSARTTYAQNGILRSDGETPGPWTGTYPEFPGIILSDEEFVITQSQARNEDGEVDPVFRAWRRFTRDEVLEDIAVDAASSYTPDVLVGPDGIVGLCSDRGVTFLHYGVGEGYFFSFPTGQTFETLLDDSVLSWAEGAAFGSSSDAPVRMDAFRDADATLLAVGCAAGDIVLWYANDADPTIRLSAEAVLSFGIPVGGVVTDLRFLPSGRLFVCGTRPSGGFGTRVWYAITDAKPDPTVNPSGVSWSVTTLDDQTIGDDPRVDISPLGVPHVVLNRVIFSVDDLDTGEPTFRHGLIDASVDFGQFQDIPPVGPLSRIRFDRGFLVVLQQLDSAFGTGALLHILDGGLRKVLWRRRFNTVVTELSSSPNAVPGSVPVYPGRTPDPLAGLGVDGVP